MKFNPSDYPEKAASAGSLIPAGRHEVEVVNHEIGETSGGHTQVIVTYQDRQGRSRQDWLICEGKAAFQFGSLCRAVNATDEIDLDSVRAVKAALYHRPLEIVVEEETYNGKSNLRVKYRNRLQAVRSDERDPGPQLAGDPGRDEAPTPNDTDLF